MRGVFVLSDTISNVTTGPHVLATISVPATAVIEPISARITCQNEDTPEQIFCQLARGTGTPAGGTIKTPKPTEEGSGASACTCRTGTTSITGTTIDDESDAFASRGANKLGPGWEYIPLPEERGIVKPSDLLILRIVDTIISSNLSIEITWREIG